MVVETLLHPLGMGRCPGGCLAALPFGGDGFEGVELDQLHDGDGLPLGGPALTGINASGELLDAFIPELPGPFEAEPGIGAETDHLGLALEIVAEHPPLCANAVELSCRAV